MIRFGNAVLNDLAAASQREWLETNGIGGFSSSTITGLNTRRYHGLLVAALTPPVGRNVLLSKLEETLVVNGTRYELGTNAYPGVVHPQGYQLLREFQLDPFPTFVFDVAGVTLTKTLFLVHGENTAVVQYSIASGPAQSSSLSLELRPMIAFRDYHSLSHENGAIQTAIDDQPGVVTLHPYDGMPSLHLAHNAVAVERAGGWFRNFQYAAEQERGLDYSEDLNNPCVLRFEISAADPATVIASLEAHDVREGLLLEAAERQRRKSIALDSPANDDFARQLTIASEQFLVDRGKSKTVIAGYHWFSDWGRDTMISLPGMTLPRNRNTVARDILLTFARSVDQGMLPNRFPDAGETPEYNTVDATLWFFEAIRSYAARTGDFDFVRNELYGILTEIIAWHVRGTRYGIHVDASGLLNSGAPGVQLTWMDAKVGDWVVTPRYGKPVEIQALWYNALCIMADFAGRFSDELGRKSYATMAALAKWSFQQTFWNDAGGYLYDVVNGETRDASIRPNQILPVSLPYALVTGERALRIIDVVQSHLLTPYGLRTLSPEDPNYRGRYTGDPKSRDGAYHQGTVWPWLLGPFLSAYLKVHQRSAAARHQAQSWLLPLRDHVFDSGVGQIHEIFEGDAPHRPAGCIAQAWSVAEVLRVWIEDVQNPD
jgi:predicted glycogen debranching enzyme